MTKLPMTTYRGMVAHPKLGNISFVFDVPVTADRAEKDVAAYKAIVNALLNDGMEVTYSNRQ